MAVRVRHEAARRGITFGSAHAISISWSANKSKLWAIIHGQLRWIYVIYYALVKGQKDKGGSRRMPPRETSLGLSD